MINKIFWALVLMGAYLVIMLSGNEQVLQMGYEKIQAYVSALMEDLEIFY